MIFDKTDKVCIILVIICMVAYAFVVANLWKQDIKNPFRWRKH